MATQFRRASTRILTGDKEIDKALGEIAKVGTANRIARAGLLKAIRVSVKAMKAEVPGNAKSVKKALKGYVKRNRKKGITEAKVGAVGKYVESTKDRSAKEGLGITGRNVHWFILGTNRRKPKEKTVLKTSRGRFLGREVAGMPAHPVVKEGWKKSQSEFQRVLKDGVRVQLLREVAKAKAKAGIR